jgi:hypothetical protein
MAHAVQPASSHPQRDTTREVAVDYYPDGFPARARARVEAEKILSYRDLDKKRKEVFSGIAVEVLVRDCIVRIFLVFAAELFTFGEEDGWTVDRIDLYASEFLRRLTITVLFDRLPSLDRLWINNWDGSLTQDAERQLRQSPKWKKYQSLLLKVAKVQQNVSTAARGPGQTIDKLRKECGWSFDDFAEETGIDRKLILSHVNKGAKPHPRTMKKYAEAFTKALNREIAVADLEK